MQQNGLFSFLFKRKLGNFLPSQTKIGYFHKARLSTLWPNKNASISFGIIFHKVINKNEKLFHSNN